MKNGILERIAIMQGDITRLSLDAIVNAANESLLGGGGVDGAIHRAAGPGLLSECRAIGGCPTGGARLTGGHNLPSRYVIHTVGPIYNPQKEDESRRLLTSCYKNCLALADDNNLSSIAFPAISCGVYGYPIEEACRIALDTACDAMEIFTSIKRLIFILFSSGDLATYSDYVTVLKSN
jgi:O-acetyl-ADP-ribose deacetylase (regulator of RNase III)